mmetsp:Transcript_1644/g.4158  ORF Transcript_1644/g.4158 Transcript_1644/m.4158 type:complete len:208 (-) Transcript_1644:452-1075(-)
MSLGDCRQGERETRSSSGATGSGRRSVPRKGGAAGTASCVCWALPQPLAQAQGCRFVDAQVWGAWPTKGISGCLCASGCSGKAGRCCASPVATPTLPVARTPQSQQPPVRLRQRGPRPERESLREVTVLLESGYTQQKVQPRQQLDVRRSRVKGQGGGAPLCAFSVPALRAQGNARRGCCNPNRPSHRHGWAWGSGFMFIGRTAAGP